MNETESKRVQDWYMFSLKEQNENPENENYDLNPTDEEMKAVFCSFTGGKTSVDNSKKNPNQVQTQPTTVSQKMDVDIETQIQMNKPTENVDNH